METELFLLPKLSDSSYLGVEETPAIPTSFDPKCEDWDDDEMIHWFEKYEDKFNVNPKKGEPRGEPKDL